MRVSTSDPDIRLADARRKPYLRVIATSFARVSSLAGFPRWRWRGTVICNDLDFTSWHYVALRYVSYHRGSVLIIIDYIGTSMFPLRHVVTLANDFSSFPIANYPAICSDTDSRWTRLKWLEKRTTMINGVPCKNISRSVWLFLIVCRFAADPRSLQQDNCVSRLRRRIITDVHVNRDPLYYTSWNLFDAFGISPICSYPLMKRNQQSIA